MELVNHKARVLVRLCLSICICLVVIIPFSSFRSVRAQEVQAESNPILVTKDSRGINVTLSGRFELYFNASNGGEITRYYDLINDPSRETDLIPSRFPYHHNLWPMFTSAFYNVYPWLVASTGMDGNAKLSILGEGANYVILQSISRIITPFGAIFKDINGNTNYIASTWLIRSDGYIFLERTLHIPTYSLIPNGMRWYAFYFSRTKGFTDTGTFHLFNTTYAYTYTVSEETYQNNYTVFPLLPTDKNGFFGVAAPFSNTSIGGDGTNNIVLVVKFNESLNISEWKSDIYQGWWGTGFGSIYEFPSNYNMTTNTYCAMIFLTHESISQQSVMSFAKYFSENPVFPLLKVTLDANKSIYVHGEFFQLNVSGTACYNMMNLDVILVAKNSANKIIWMKNYGTYNISEGQKWSDVILVNGTIPLKAPPGDYTFTLFYLSSIRIIVASDNVMVSIISS